MMRADRRLRAIGSASLLVTALAACGAPPTEDPGAAALAIRGGTPAPADDAVGMLLLDDVGRTCTGALIAPNVVLTAAHCARERVSAFVTGRTPERRVRHEVARTAVEPTFGGRCGVGLDVGLVRLADDVVGIDPSVLGDDAPEAGARCRAVGLGIHPLEDGGVERGTKRQATCVVGPLAEGTLVATAVDGIADKGDSGGPLYVDARLVGVASCHVDGEGSAHREEIYARVDSARSWIEATLAQWREQDGQAGLATQSLQ